MKIEEIFVTTGVHGWLRAARAAGMSVKQTEWGTSPQDQNVIVHDRRLYVLTTKKRDNTWGICAQPLPHNAVHPLTIKVAVPLSATTKECLNRWADQAAQAYITPELLHIRPEAGSEEVLCHLTWGDMQLRLVRRDGIVFACKE